MRTLLLASAAVFALAATPTLADSLLSGGNGARVGAGVNADVGANVGGNAVNVGTSGTGVQADTHTVVDAGASSNATSAATGAVDSATTAGTSTAIDAAADVQNSAQSGAQDVVAAGQLIGKTVVDANGATVGEVSNAVLATDAHAVSKIVVASGGFLGIGAREVAVDAANVDASAASQGTVQLRGL